MAANKNITKSIVKKRQEHLKNTRKCEYYIKHSKNGRIKGEIIRHIEKWQSGTSKHYLISNCINVNRLNMQLKGGDWMKGF